MQPETREILQCVYAPRMAELDPATGQPKAEELPVRQRINSPFAKQAILSAVFDNPQIADTVLKNMKGSSANFRKLTEVVTNLHLPAAGQAAKLLNDIPIQQVASFARTAVNTRQKLSEKSARTVTTPKTSKQEKNVSKDISATTNILSDSAALTLGFQPRSRLSLIDTLENASKVDPVGFLHLERLHFTPVGHRRGELMYSITLLPGEVIKLTHKEWSRTEKEFTSLVSETLENAKEEAISEKNELSESTSNQRNHSMAFSASLSASGSYGVVSVAANAGFSFSQQESSTRETSTRQTRELTKKASSRAKQEHKVTFKVSTSFETEDTSYRELKNESTEAIRWDFNRVMKEWNVKLYRYGLRLTYDITIPEPASYLLRHYKELLRLEQEIAKPLDLPSIGQITVGSINTIQNQYGLILPPPPPVKILSSFSTMTWGGENDTQADSTILLTIPDGYEIDSTGISTAFTEAKKDWTAGDRPANITSRTFMNSDLNIGRLQPGPITGQFNWIYGVFWYNFPRQSAKAIASISYRVKPLASSIDEWRAKTYSLLIDTLRARHEEKLQLLSQQRDAILQKIGNIDTIQLRRMEREEIMKGVLRWILGPSFRFYDETLPANLIQLQGELNDPGADEPGPDGRRQGFYSASTNTVVDESVWRATLRHGQLISFLHQAIEWENVNYILYPYFWSEPSRWDFKSVLSHADMTHLEFLRSGAARVVVTIRPGFETAWLHLVSTGDMALADGTSDTYMPIAAQIKAAAQTYQAHTEGVQPLDEPGVLIGEWNEWTPTGALDAVRGGILT